MQYYACMHVHLARAHGKEAAVYSQELAPARVLQTMHAWIPVAFQLQLGAHSAASPPLDLELEERLARLGCQPALAAPIRNL